MTSPQSHGMQANPCTQHLTINNNQKVASSSNASQHLIVNKCTRTHFCMHHGKQGGLGRTRSQEMHTFEEQSWFSPTWKLILWQERLNLPETRTATNHKGASPFPKEGRLKAPANTFQQGKRHITIRPTRTHPCQSGSQNAMKM